MSLFGAATSGVNPQTGAYLSKEQRIAMFRASRGLGGTGGGGGTQSGRRANVEPKAAIVVANKFASITQTLNNNFQKSATNIADQVQTNKQSIENLYNVIANKRTQELKTEKQETRSASLNLEKTRRKSRENFIEGISKAANDAMVPLAKAANKATNKLGGFWDKIKQFLLMMGGAWLIDNLPTILDAIESFDLSVGDFSDEAAKILPHVRGIFTIFDDIVRGVLKSVKRIASASLRVANKVGRASFRIARKVFNAIRNVTTKVAGAIFNGIKKLTGNLFRLYKSAKAKLLGTPKGVTPDKPGAKKSLIDKMGDGLRGFGGKVRDFGDKYTGGGFSKMQQGASSFMRGFKDIGSKAMEKINPLSNYAKSNNVAKGTSKSRAQGVADLLGKVFEKAGIAGKGLLKKTGGIINKLVKLPGIGIAIDIMLNKAGGQGMQESLIRGLASGITGMIGMKAGAGVGAGIGTLILPGIGTVAGGLLGGLLGSILASMGGDALAKAGMEMSGMETTSDAEMSANYSNIIKNITNNNDNSNIDVKSGTHPESSIKIKPGDRVSGSSTPDGMQLSNGSAGMMSANNFNLEELPPIMTRMNKEEPPQFGAPQQLKTISTKDPQSDVYRKLAGKLYQLSGVE